MRWRRSIVGAFTGGALLLLTASGCSNLRYYTEEELWTEADRHFDQGQYGAAVPYYDELVRRDADETRALLMRGVSRERTGDSSDALRDYARAGAKGEVRALLYRANLNIARGDTASAEEDLAQLRNMNLDGRDRLIHLTLLGTLRLKQGQPRLAAQSLEQAIAAGQGYSDPIARRHIADAQCNAAEAYYRMGDFGRAYDHYQAYAHGSGAGARGGRGGYGAPLPTLSGEEYYMLGLLAYLAGDFPAAESHLSRADPDLVSRAAEILDDPSFGGNRQRGLK